MAKKKKKSKPKSKDEAMSFLRTFQKEQQKAGVNVSFGMEPRGRRYFRYRPLNTFTGGLLRGSWVVFWGPENAGKTTAALDLTAAELQVAEENNEFVVIGDVEGTLIGNEAWLQRQRINTNSDRLIILHGMSMESMCDAMLEMIANGIRGTYIIDSISAMAPKGELEDKSGKSRSMENDTVGLRARQANKFGRMAIGKGFAMKDITIVMIGQVYTQVNAYGGPQVLSLGTGMKHLSFLRLKFQRGAKATWPTRRNAEGKDEYCGFMSQIRMEKVKQDRAKPEGSVLQIPFVYGHGFHYACQLFNEGKALGLVKSTGKKWSIGDKLEFTNGKAEMEDWLYDDPEAENILYELIHGESNGTDVHETGADDTSETPTEDAETGENQTES